MLLNQIVCLLDLSRADNGRIRLERFRRLGLLFLSDLRPAPA